MLNALFVYGTLAPGEPNERFLKPLKGRWQPAWAEGHLYPNGIGITTGYPALDISAQGKTSGLLFSSEELVEHWDVLDEFEGPGYCRTEITVYLKENDQPVQAYVYAFDKEA